MGSKFSKEAFDYPVLGAEVSSVPSYQTSASLFYSLAQQARLWPDYYMCIDFRTMTEYEKCHVVGAEHFDNVTVAQAADMILVLYAKNGINVHMTNFLNALESNSVVPAKIYILNESFETFRSRYRVMLSNHTMTQGEQPGPLELIPATKRNPAVYFIHRHQFQYCKSSIAFLGCSLVINISSRRLFLKTASIKVENIQFDGVAEPYDSAIATFSKHMLEAPKVRYRGNILYGSLLVGWWWYEKNNDLERVCELLIMKFGELDPWYLDVLRAWADAAKDSKKS